MTSIVLAAAVGTSILAAASMQTGQQQERQDRERERQDRERQAEMFEGRIVDLHHYMTLEGTPDVGDSRIAGENFGGPVGLLVEEDRMIRGTRTVLYVVLVEPERAATPGGRDQMPERGGPQQPEHDKQDRSKAGSVNYKQAQKMTGERVRITGKEIERDNVKAIVIRNIQPISGERERDGQGRPGR